MSSAYIELLTQIYWWTETGMETDANLTFYIANKNRNQRPTWVLEWTHRSSLNEVNPVLWQFGSTFDSS